jgi:hypothetical protein
MRLPARICCGAADGRLAAVRLPGFRSLREGPCLQDLGLILAHREIATDEDRSAAFTRGRAGEVIISVPGA